jgi:DNA-binding response OmpR family regulator
MCAIQSEPIVKVLLVEDEIELGKTIESILDREGYRVELFSDGKAAWDSIVTQAGEWDLAIVDWMIPGVSGIELCQKIRQLGQMLPILMLTAKGDVLDRVAGLDAGADDYLVKPFSKLELLARLRALYRRGQPQSTESPIDSSVYLDPDMRCLKYRDRHAEFQSIMLTNKEYQILEYLLKHANKIVTTERIHNYIWDLSSDTFSNVVASHIRLIRKKLAGTEYANLIQTVPQTGYRLELP